MNLIYRMCPEGNPAKLRPLGMNKMQVVETCYKSVIKAFNCEIHFIVDKPNMEIIEMVEECPLPHTIETTHFDSWNEGNIGTFHRQLDIASKLDKVVLIEDDYFFLPSSGKVIEEALDQFDFLTPYDHPGYYTEETHNYKRDVALASDRHWQTVISTCLTFASHGKVIKDNLELIKSYGWADHPMWVELTKQYKLWSPIPSLATHMETPYIAPNVIWPIK